MDANAKEICEQAKRAFGRRAAVDSLREEIAWNFDPALATFFSARFEGEDFAAHIFEATGALNARDFSGSLQSPAAPRQASPGFAAHPSARRRSAFRRTNSSTGILASPAGS